MTDIILEAAAVSSGVISQLTGRYSCKEIDTLQGMWVRWLNNQLSHDFDTWQEAFDAWWKERVKAVWGDESLKTMTWYVQQGSITQQEYDTYCELWENTEDRFGVTKKN